MQRVLFGIICAAAAGIAEMWFLLRISMVKEAEVEQNKSLVQSKIGGIHPPRM